MNFQMGMGRGAAVAPYPNLASERFGRNL